MNTKPASLADLAKSYGRSASPNEEITSGLTGETLAGRQGKTWVTNKISKSGWWRLEPQRSFEVASTKLPWTGLEAGENQAILSKGHNVSCHQHTDPTQRNLKEVSYFPRQRPIIYAVKLAV